MSTTLSSLTKSGSKLLNRFVTSPSFNPAIKRTTRSLETLAYEEVRSSPDKPYTTTALVLHGLLGSGRNWRSFSRALASSLSDKWRMVLVDLRNHGKSVDIEGFSPPHEIGSAAQDLANLVKLRGWDWPDVVIGHSMGGKVALHFAQSCARGDYGAHVRLPRQITLTDQTPNAEQLWIFDSVPGKVNPEDGDGEVEKVLQTLRTLPSPIPSRNVATMIMIIQELVKL